MIHSSYSELEKTPMLSKYKGQRPEFCARRFCILLDVGRQATLTSFSRSKFATRAFTCTSWYSLHPEKKAFFILDVNT